MSTSKHIDRICCIAIALVIVLTIVFCNAGKFGVETVTGTEFAYTDKLFDTSKVHTLDIIIDDWDVFLEDCESEEYETCNLVIDNEAFKNVAIRAKGNTSLSQVKNYGNSRYSFKVEFDHYDSSNTYYGLDKLCLNNIIQDNTYMKDYLTYQMMYEFGADAPLCSYVYITVNGEDWGLYLAVEAVEDSFLERNYGGETGELYKPDSQSMGGGRGNGREFDMDKFKQDESDSTETTDQEANTNMENRSDNDMNSGPGGGMGRGAETTSGGGMNFGPGGGMGFGAETTSGGGMNFGPGGGNGGGMGQSMGSDDVCLIYSDDDFDSYSSIFENAKTDVSDADKARLIASIKSMNEDEDIEEVVNVEEVIRYFVVHNFVVNFDSYTGSMIHNYYLYEEDGQMSMIPWDYNLAFGGFIGGTDASSAVNYPIDTPVSGGDVDSRPMLAWIFHNDTYTEMYHTYFEEFISEYFDSGKFEEMIDTVSAMIAPYVESDPTKFCTYEEFETGVDTLKQFCLLRAESVSGQLEGTIPSTSDEQSEDSTTLVDASSISISDMGSMNNGAGGGGMQMGGGMPGEDTDSSEGMQMPENTETTSESEMQPPEGMQMQENTETTSGSEMQPPKGMQMPENTETTSGSAMQMGGGMPGGDMNSSGGMQMPDDMDFSGETQQTNRTASAAMLGVSAIILLLGILATRVFKDRI